MKSFTIYKEFTELTSLLPLEEQKDFWLKIINYMIYDEEITDLTDKENKVYINIRRVLDKIKIKSKNKLNKVKTKSKQNQNKNEIKSNKNQNEIETKSHQDVNVNVNVNNNVLKKIGYGEEKTFKDFVEEVINYLNLKTKSNFKNSTSKTKELIKARINEGFCLDDFKKVIDVKAFEWLNTDFEKFLRPETLFSNKFEGYLNQKSNNKNPSWWNKKIEKEEVSADELAELQKELEVFK